MMRRGVFIISMFLITALAAQFFAVPSARAADSAVVIMYHRFGEATHPSTNIRTEQFERHLEILGEGSYTVWPLAKIVDAVRNNQPLPERTVAITIDDGYRSIYTTAWPRLKALSLPFTIFLSTNPIDEGSRSFMSWDQLREMVGTGLASVENHTASHLHMPLADKETLRREIDTAQVRIEKELGIRPSLFAYPYGEMGADVREVVKEAGFLAAFGQHSGAVGQSADRFFLPRFALNESYGDEERFRLVSKVKPLPVAEVTPADPLITKKNPPSFGFTVVRQVGNLENLNCYPSTRETPSLMRLGERRFELRLKEPFPAGRTRINCTVRDGNGDWRWFSQMFYVPPRDGVPAD